MSTSMDDSKFSQRVRRIVGPVIDEEIVRFSHNLLASCVEHEPDCKLPEQVRPMLEQIMSAQTSMANKLAEMKDEVRRIEYVVTDPTQEEADDKEKDNPHPTDPLDTLDKLVDAIPDSEERSKIMEFIEKVRKYGVIAKGLQLGSAAVNLIRTIIEGFTTYNKMVEIDEDTKAGVAEIMNSISSAQRIITDQAYVQAASLNHYLKTSFQGVFDGLAALGNMIETCCANSRSRFDSIDDKLDEIESAIQGGSSGPNVQSELSTIKHQLNADRGFL